VLTCKCVCESDSLNSNALVSLGRGANCQIEGVVCSFSTQ
jgi:hypothetical protein